MEDNHQPDALLDMNAGFTLLTFKSISSVDDSLGLNLYISKSENTTQFKQLWDAGQNLVIVNEIKCSTSKYLQNETCI